MGQPGHGQQAYQMQQEQAQVQPWKLKGRELKVEGQGSQVSQEDAGRTPHSAPLIERAH
jgi:hypothetical protein